MPRTRAIRKVVLIAAALSLLALSCAKVGAPPGGPEDKTGPALVQSYPNNNAVQVPRKLVARLVFSKPVNFQSVESGLFLSPDPRQRLRYRWSKGRILDLVYLDSLEANRTYVISVGSQAKDLRGNPTGSTFTIAFSTGDRIDRGRVAGWIADAPSPQAVSLWAYRFSGDSVGDPAATDADYRIQAGADGHFLLNYMKFGRYRVFAVTDKNFDGRWTPATELLGLPPWDISVTDSSQLPWLSFKLSDQDSAPAALRSVREIYDSRFDLKTTRVVSSLSARFERLDGDTIVQAESRIDSAGSDLWHVYPLGPLRPGDWLVTASGLDRAGKLWYDSDSVNVRAREDTARARLLASDPRHSERKRTAPAAVQLTFEQPVRYDSAFTSRVFLFADSDSVAFRAVDQSALGIRLVPVAAMQPGKKYRLRLDGRLVRNIADRTLADTTVIIPFSIYPKDSLGSIQGTLESSPAGQYIYRVLAIRDHREITTVTAPGPGPFQIESLPAGQYLLEVIQDKDGDGKYSYGSLTPWRFAEPYIQSPDTAAVRARWEYEMSVTWKEIPQVR
jgi:uncharacterized protein (DUF2141 family)